MKWYFFSIIIFLLFQLNNCELRNIDFNSSLYSENSENSVDNAIENIKNLILGAFFELGEGTFDEDEEDKLYKVIESFDEECVDFFVNFILDTRSFMNKITKKLIHDGGLIQFSLGVEDDCLQEDGVYMFFSGQYNITELKMRKNSEDEEALFKETFEKREEICIFKECKNLYEPLIDYLKHYNKKAFLSIFEFNFTTIKMNYKDNNNSDLEEIFYDKEKRESDETYFNIIKNILIAFGIFFLICSLITWLIRKNNKVIEINFRNFSSENILLKEDLKQISTAEKSLEKSNTLTAKEKTYEDLCWFKIISSFDFFNNLSILNQKKEPLSNQTSLIELSTIKIIILFLLLYGENGFILMKYIENKTSIFSFCKSLDFINSKVGMNSYEFYKVISGVIFGFKFMNYYNNAEKFTAKKFWRFCTKPFPYIISFIIIHFIFNYPSFIFATKLINNIRNNYISESMCEYECQRRPFNIFKIFSILGDYDSTRINIGLFNGCTRPILFTFSELVCFYIVMVLIAFHITFRNKISNIIYTIFFYLNFLILSLSYFLSKETKDLKGEYTVSRLFGLSGSLAMPHLFFPLYYIGFNIGIIYYYHLNELSNKLIAEKETHNFIPFKYCNDISSFVTRRNHIIKNIFILIFFFLIILASSYYYSIVNDLKDNEIIFTFEDKPIMKYMYVYEGFIVGILFSFLLLIYLCLDANSFIRNVLSSGFFNFTHKISFVWFITFISVLNFFHIIGLMEINLTNFAVFLNSLTFFIISCLLSIVATCLFLLPIKWIYFFICNGLNNDEYKEQL